MTDALGMPTPADVKATIAGQDLQREHHEREVHRHRAEADRLRADGFDRLAELEEIAAQRSAGEVERDQAVIEFLDDFARWIQDGPPS